MYTRPRFGLVGRAGERVGVVLNLSKSCRLLGVSNVYALRGGQCFQSDTLCSCPSLLAHATHIQEWWKCGWASNHEIPECVVDVLRMEQVKQRLFSPLHCSFCMLNKCKALKLNSFFSFQTVGPDLSFLLSVQNCKIILLEIVIKKIVFILTEERNKCVKRITQKMHVHWTEHEEWL